MLRFSVTIFFVNVVVFVVFVLYIITVCVLVLPMTIIQWRRRQLNGEIASILCTYFVVHTQIAVAFSISLSRPPFFFSVSG